MRTPKYIAYQPHKSLHRDPGVYQVTGFEFYPDHGGGEAFLAKPGMEALSSEYLEDIILMQLTGLKDRHGNDIHEDHVIRRQHKKVNGDLNGHMYRVVKWECRKAKNGWNVTCGENWEVVGNIHENKELLNKSLY